MSATRRIGRRRGLLSIEELHEDPAGLSLASGPGPQSCAALFHRLLAMREARPRMATQRRKRRSPTTAAPLAGHSSRYLENRRPRCQAPADSNPPRAQYDAGSARSASTLLPTASLG